MSEQVRRTLLHLGKGLRARHDDATREPLPKRWMDLILYLDEQERKQLSGTENQPRRRNE